MLQSGCKRWQLKYILFPWAVHDSLLLLGLRWHPIHLIPMDSLLVAWMTDTCMYGILLSLLAENLINSSPLSNNIKVRLKFTLTANSNPVTRSYWLSFLSEIHKVQANRYATAFSYRWYCCISVSNCLEQLITFYQLVAPSNLDGVNLMFVSLQSILSVVDQYDLEKR